MFRKSIIIMKKNSYLIITFLKYMINCNIKFHFGNYFEELEKNSEKSLFESDEFINGIRGE